MQISRASGLVATFLCAAASTLRAQDSLRVLRFVPQGVAASNENVVIAFDHPVAPRLEESIKAASVVRVRPVVPMRAYWQDPSTIVVRFDNLWKPGSAYRVSLSAGLRSADSLPLAASDTARVVHVAPASILDIRTRTSDGYADTLVRIDVVTDAPVQSDWLRGRAWLLPRETASPDTIALLTERVRTTDRRDAEIMPTNLDRRLDTLRRVVELVAARALPRGTAVRFDVQAPGSSVQYHRDIVVRLPFGMRQPICGSSECKAGPLHLYFTERVPASEIRAHVRVNGAAPAIGGDSSVKAWTIVPSLAPRKTYQLEVDAGLHSVDGERLPRPVGELVRVPPRAPSVTYVSGSYVVPTDESTLLSIRHVNTDSVLVVVGRVRPEQRERALRGFQYGWARTAPPIAWRTSIADSVVLRYATPFANDTTGTLAVPMSDLPRDWGIDAPVMVRAVGLTDQVGDEAEAKALGVRVESLKPAEVAFALLRRSTIALHLHDTPGDLRAWVTSLRDTRSLDRVQVRLLDTLGHQIAAGMTDERGMVRLRYAPRRDLTAGNLLVEARCGEDVALQSLQRGGPFGIRGDDDDDDRPYYWYRHASETPGLHGAAFSERGIYRPGEAVYLKAIVRRFDPEAGYHIARRDSARWSVRRVIGYGTEERIWSHTSRLSEFGTSVDTFTVPRTARLGEYSAMLAVHDATGWHRAAATSLSVAEYRVPEFSVSVAADTMRQWFAGDSVPVGLAARYLYGVPMQGVQGSWWTVTHELSPWGESVRGLAGWIVGRPWWMVPGGHEESSDTPPAPLTTGADGRVTLPVPVRALTRPGRVTVYTEVADASRQRVSAQTEFTVHAANVYIGARIAGRRWYESVGQPIRVQMLVVDAEGRRRTGTPIHVYALRRDWSNSRQLSDTVLRTQITSTSDTLDFQFTPTKTGLYELLFSARDERARESQTGVFLWVFDGRAAGVGGSELRMTLDKPRYAPGDTIIARVVTPDPGSALVTLSHEGILSQSVVRLVEGPNVVRVAVPENATPSATLTVFALRPTRPNVSSRVYSRSATAAVTIAEDSKALQVAVIPDRARYQPRDTVHLALQVRDHHGRGVRSEVAVWALDEGVAMLTAFLKPDVLSELLTATGDPSSFVTTLSSMIPELSWWNEGHGQIRIRGASANLNLESVVVTGASAFSGKASGSGVADAPLRQRFMTTPFYRGAIATDANGHAETRFVLPDNLTKFRLFAVAVDQTVRAGSADTSIVSTRTLAVRAALPRVIRAGDTLRAGAVITQDRDGRAPVSLRAEGTGVQLEGASTVTDTLVDRAPRELRFSVLGLEGDTATLRFFGRTQRDADAVEARLPVSPAGHPRARVSMGTITGPTQVAFGFDEALDTIRSRLQLQLGNSALPLLQRLSENLRLYPYYCTEQISSTGHALIARLRAEEMLGGASTLASRDRAQLETAVATLVQRQRDDGGIGYWSATNWTTPWLTAYAVRFLDEARRAGIDVPATTLARARAYLAEVGRANDGQLRTKLAATDSSSYAREQLASAMVLRRIGTPDSASERRVASLAHRLDWVDRLTLAQLLAMRGDSAAARTIVDTAWRATRREGRRIVVDDSVAPRYWLFRSIVRPVSALLSATAATAPNDPRLEPLFESLIHTGSADRSWNTIDQTLIADAVVAMLSRPHVHGTTPVTVSSGERTLATTEAGASRSDTIRVALSNVTPRAERGDTARLSFAVAKPTMPVYYAATLFEVPRARPVRADDEGISVERWYERYNEPTPIVSVREGELVRVRIRVTVPADREFVVVDDPLPAGLEAVDLSLRTSATLPPFEGAPRLRAEQDAEGPLGQRYLYGSWDAGWWTPWEHREIRDDRVLYFARQLWKGSYLVSYVARATSAGTFVRPPAHAEEMYNPALHGRSDGGWFTVTPVK